MRETGIFTGTTSSLCPSLRQLPDRYAIRAGRNLPDKAFRYLRTVIVTAAIHWGFDSQLRLTANRSSKPSSIGQASAPIRCLYNFAETCVFVKQSPGTFLCDRVLGEHGYPSPEVTDTFCRVPERGFSQAP